MKNKPHPNSGRICLMMTRGALIHDFTFRNSDYAVGTLLMRIALGAPHHAGAIRCVFSDLYILGVSWSTSRLMPPSDNAPQRAGPHCSSLSFPEKKLGYTPSLQSQRGKAGITCPSAYALPSGRIHRRKEYRYHAGIRIALGCWRYFSGAFRMVCPGQRLFPPGFVFSAALHQLPSLFPDQSGRGDIEHQRFVIALSHVARGPVSLRFCAKRLEKTRQGS